MTEEKKQQEQEQQDKKIGIKGGVFLGVANDGNYIVQPTGEFDLEMFCLLKEVLSAVIYDALRNKSDEGEPDSE